MLHWGSGNLNTFPPAFCMYLFMLHVFCFKNIYVHVFSNSYDKILCVKEISVSTNF